MTTQKIRIKRSELENLSDEELRLLANNLFKLEEANKNKRAEFYLERMTCVQKEMHSTESRFMCVWAGNRCLSGDALIQTKSGIKKLRDIQENELVVSFDQVSNRLRYSRSSAAILKGSDRLVRVVHEAGGFVGHNKHAVFCSDGEYRLLEHLRAGDEFLFCDDLQASTSQCRSIEEPCPIVFLSDAFRLNEKSAGYEDGCPSFSHSHDPQQTFYPAADLGFLVQQSDVIKLLKSLDHEEFCEHLDNLLGLRLVRNRLGLQRNLFESFYDHAHAWVHGLSLEDQTSAKFLVHSSQQFQLGQQSHEISDGHQKGTELTLPSLRKSRIISITEIDGDQEYYDIQVPGLENFLTADGTIHHNSGKSTGGVMELRWRVLGDHPFKKVKIPIKAAVVCTDFENHLNKVIEPKIHEWFPPNELQKASITRNQTKALKTIRLQNGSTIDFMSHEQDPMIFESSDYDFVLCDEPVPHQIFKAIWRGLTDRGGDFLLTGTPIVQPWMIQEYKLWEAGNQDGLNRHFIIGKTEDNAHNLGDGDKELGMKRIREFAAMLTPEEREARLEGKPLELAGMVFKSWNRATHITKPFDWPHDWPIIESIDPHPRKPAGCSWIGLAPNGAKILISSGYLEGDVVELGDEILRYRESLPIKDGKKPQIIRTLIDNASNAPLTGRSIQSQVRERISYREELEAIIGPRGAGGPRIEAPPKNVSGKIDALKAWLTVRDRDERVRPDFFVFDVPENEDFIKEIEGYIWAKYKNRDRAGFKDQPVKKDDDILDSVLQVALTYKGHIQKEQEIANVFKSRETYSTTPRGAYNGR